MKRLAPLALSLLLAAGAYAQRGGMGGGRGGFGGGGMRGGGGMVRGGGFHGGGFHGGGFHGGGFGRGGFVHGGFPRGGFVRGHVGVAAPFGFGFHNGFVNPLFAARTLQHKAFFSPGFGFGLGFNKGFWGGGFGWGGGWGGGWPIYVGGVYADDPFYNYPYYPAEPNITVIGAPYSQPAPPVVVQAYTPPPPPPQPVHSSIKEYGPGEPPREVARGTSGSEIYLLAFKDGVIRAALAYWVEGGALHYVGTDRKNHQVPLTSINRDFSAQLNRERRVSFNLPEP